MTLLPHHLEELRQSGLSDETIAAAGIFSETNHRTLAALLNRKNYSRKNGPAMAYPFHDEAGTVVLHRIKPDHPAKHGSGKPAKYLSPVGAAVRAYVPRSVNGEINDSDRALLITEGEKKALKATQDGFLCVGLTGCDCWHAKRSSALIPDLARIPWKNRLVYIVFDSDAVSNENIETNESLLAVALQNQGATVKVVRLPPGPDDKKVGLDDYLVKHGADALNQLLNQAEDPTPPDPDLIKVPAALLDPAPEAENLLAANTKDSVSRLRFWRGSFYWWSKGAYREKDQQQVRGEVVQHLNHRACHLTGVVVANLLDQLRAHAMLNYETESPAMASSTCPALWRVNRIKCRIRHGCFR